MNGKSTSNELETANYGIFVEYNCSGISIMSNTVKNMNAIGISMQLDSSVSSITGNKISDCSDKGIQLYSNCSVTGEFSGNTITNAVNGGIVLTTSSTAASLKNNIITGTTKDAAIVVYKDSKVTGAISGNTVSGCSSHAISVEPGTTGYLVTLTSNKLTGNGSKTYGIVVKSGKVSVSSNTFSNVGIATYVMSGAEGDVYTNTYSSGVTTEIRVANKKYSTPKVSSLKLTAGSKKITASWKKVSGATKYEVEYSQKSTFKSSTVKSTTKVKLALTKLTKGKKYYVRVRPVITYKNVSIYGTWVTKSAKAK